MTLHSSSPVRYDPVAVALHWIIAVGVLALIILGLWMVEIPKQPAGVRAYWFNLHKSIGISVGLLVLIRVGWRLRHRPPPLPPGVPSWQSQAAKVSHVLLYVCMITMPLAGYFGSVFSGYPIKYFGAQLPAWGWKDDGLKEIFSTVHYAAAMTFIVLIAVHVMAALKHALIDRDGVLQRMLPRRRTAPVPQPSVARGHGA